MFDFSLDLPRISCQFAISTKIMTSPSYLCIHKSASQIAGSWLCQLLWKHHINEICNTSISTNTFLLQCFSTKFNVSSVTEKNTTGLILHGGDYFQLTQQYELQKNVYHINELLVVGYFSNCLLSLSLELQIQ